MNKFDEMNAEQIREYLEGKKCSLEEVRDIYSHEANGEMREDVMEAIGKHMAGLIGPEKKAKAKPKAKVEKKG